MDHQSKIRESLVNNKICLVTGGTSGVGKATALGVAKLGATVVILSRSAQRGEEVADQIKDMTCNRNIFYRKVDLENFDDIKRFTEEFKKDFTRLDVLSNNAALLLPRRELTKQGIEKMFAVNYLSHFLLVNLLLNQLKSSAPSRVITVAGNPSLLRYGKLDLDDINIERGFNPLKASFRATVAKVMFSMELAKRVRGTGVTSNTFHPGLVKTNLSHNLPRFLQIFFRIGQFFLNETSETSVYLASSQEVENVTGKFFKNKKIVEYHPSHQIEDNASALWCKSEELVGLVKK
jgi:NAD(P)-dependent dehydrogenase (short-subunit alcohol dehydrogenase family)